MSEAELKQAIQLIKAGEKEDGKMLLLQYVRKDSSNEDAWLWLATVLDGKHRIDCLEWALKINPQNKRTREFLLKLNPDGGYERSDWQKRITFWAASQGRESSNPYRKNRIFPQGMLFTNPMPEKF